MVVVPYVSVDQLKDVILGGGTDPSGTAASLAKEVLADRIDTAQSVVDSRLSAAGYQVPFDDPAPPLVRDITSAIAAWLADLTYRKGKAPSSNLDPILQRDEWAQRQLDAIAGGISGSRGAGSKLIPRTALIPGVPPPDSEVEEGTGAVAVVAIQPGGGQGSGFLYPGTMPPRYGGYGYDDGW